MSYTRHIATYMIAKRPDVKVKTIAKKAAEFNEFSSGNKHDYYEEMIAMTLSLNNMRLSVKNAYKQAQRLLTQLDKELDKVTTE